MTGRGLIGLACALGAAALLAVSGASAQGTQKKDADCTWGASSVIPTTVNGPEHGDGPPVLACVADEELALSVGHPGYPGVTVVSPAEALWAAWATVSLSTKPSIRKASFAGRVWMKRPGSGSG